MRIQIFRVYKNPHFGHSSSNFPLSHQPGTTWNYEQNLSNAFGSKAWLCVKFIEQVNIRVFIVVTEQS